VLYKKGVRFGKQTPLNFLTLFFLFNYVIHIEVKTFSYQSLINRYSVFFMILPIVLVEAGLLRAESFTESFGGSSIIIMLSVEISLVESRSDGIPPAFFALENSIKDKLNIINIPAFIYLKIY